jgi:hypothetical protein
MFREHPLFTPATQKNDPYSGLGIIKNPIPARHFVERSIPIITDAWRVKFVAMRERFNARLDAVARTYE